MNLTYLSQGDWFEFARQYPNAEAFLLQKSLEGELHHLHRLHGPTPWQASRLAELEAFFAEFVDRDVTHGETVTIDLEPGL